MKASTITCWNDASKSYGVNSASPLCHYTFTICTDSEMLAFSFAKQKVAVSKTQWQRGHFCKDGVPMHPICMYSHVMKKPFACSVF